MSYEEQAEAVVPIAKKDFSDFPTVPRRIVIRKTPSGEIALEQGADGLYLRFDCDCIDALPYCQAQCCALVGTIVFPEELNAQPNLPVDWDDELKQFVLNRDSDGFCTCLDRRTRLCSIYQQRPSTCQKFHCTRGASQRGWKLSNRVHRQSEI